MPKPSTPRHIGSPRVIFERGIDAKGRFGIRVAGNGVRLRAAAERPVKARPRQIVRGVVLELAAGIVFVDGHRRALAAAQGKCRKLPAGAHIQGDLALHVAKAGEILVGDRRRDRVVVGAAR
jgi:hypothetical protein